MTLLSKARVLRRVKVDTSVVVGYDVVMAIKFDKLHAGMHLLDIHSERAGNTTMRRLGCWPVVIVSIDARRYGAMVRWNGNAPRWWGRKELQRLYAKVPPRYRKELDWVHDPVNDPAPAPAKAEVTS